MTAVAADCNGFPFGDHALAPLLRIINLAFQLLQIWAGRLGRAQKARQPEAWMNPEHFIRIVILGVKTAWNFDARPGVNIAQVVTMFSRTRMSMKRGGGGHHDSLLTIAESYLESRVT